MFGSSWSFIFVFKDMTFGLTLIYLAVIRWRFKDLLLLLQSLSKLMA